MTNTESPDTDHEVAAEHHETVSFFSEHPPRRFDQILVTGLGRSGTSAIGSLLHHCGYWMGEKEEVNPRLHENVRLRNLLLEQNYEELHSILDDWQGKHEKIAWKEPKLYLQKHRGFCKSFPGDWLLIVVFRDPVALSQRRIYIELESLLDTLLHVTESQNRLCQFLLRRKKPTLVVSYEKFLSAPETAIREIRHYLNLGSEETLPTSSLLKQMQEDKLAYQEHARQQKAEFEKRINQTGEPSP